MKKGMTAINTKNEFKTRDTFQTPKWATELIATYLNHKSVWECACGGGFMVRSLETFGIGVYATDKYVQREIDSVIDFLSYIKGQDEIADSCDAIVTNPPFSMKLKFLEKCFELGKPFALLIPLDYCQSIIKLIDGKNVGKIIPYSRINYISPNTIERINKAEGASYSEVRSIESELLYKHSSAQFHSAWFTYGLSNGNREIFVDVPLKYRKENMI